MKKTVLGLVAASILSSGSVFAGPIEGTISFSGEILGLGTVPDVGAEISSEGQSGAFSSSGLETLSDDTTTTITFGTVLTLDGQRSGDYTTLNGPVQGFFNDIQIVDGVIITPIAPLWTATEAPGHGGSTASFTMTAAEYLPLGDGNDPDPDFAIFLGEGILSLTGFDDTPGEFRMTSEWPFLEFSASNVADATVVPAPGALGLMAMGLASLVAARKRGKAS